MQQTYQVFFFKIVLFFFGPLLTVQVVNRQASIVVQCLKEVGWRFQVWKTQRNAYLSLGGRSSVGSRAITCLYIRHAGWQCYVMQDQVCKMQLRDLLKFRGVGKNKDKYKIDPSILNLCHLQFVLINFARFVSDSKWISGFSEDQKSYTY